MVQRRPGLWLVVLMLLFVAPLFPVQAQAPSRTFPETGKTVGGRFLAVLERITAGWPSRATRSPRRCRRPARPTARPTRCSISSAPCSSTTRRTRAPYDVLLSAAGHLPLPARSIRSGAPGQVPNTDSRLAPLPRDGQARSGGTFLDYWTEPRRAGPAGLSDLRRVHREERPGRQDRTRCNTSSAPCSSSPREQGALRRVALAVGHVPQPAQYAATLAQRSGTGNQVPAAFR